jgi:hypothetical protein
MMKRYLCHSLLTLTLLAAAVGGFNLWVDPYAIYRFDTADSARIGRINQIYQMRVSKPWQVRRLKPSALIIGSSRSASIRPQHAQWDDNKAFNLSMPGLTLYEMQRLIQHAHVQGNLRKLVIGLEHETFTTNDYTTGIGFAEGRLAGAGAGAVAPHFHLLVQTIRDLRDTLFTGFALTRSLQAWLGPHQGSHRYRPDGSWENLSHIWLGEPGYVFVGGMLAQKEGRAASALDDNLAIFADILGFCHRHSIDTRIFISPEHLFLTDLRQYLGSDSGWKQFHRELVTLNENVAREHDQPAFPVWGFNQLEGIVDEQLQPGPGTLGEWFRDGIHFDHRLGKVLMEQMWGTDSDQGLALDTGSVPAYFEQVELARTQFVRDQSAIVARYRQKILGDVQPPVKK